MDEKLKKIAKKLSKNRHDTPSLSRTYVLFMEQSTKQWEYFQGYKPIELLRIVFYIFSYKQTGNFEWAENAIKNSYVGNYFEFSDGDFANVTCDECGGNGHVTCDYCDGSGNKRCDTCDGNGEVECEECDGTGEVDGEECGECRGRGEYTCNDCAGDAETNCNECDGSGSVNCNECDGNGELDSDELVYYNSSFITWDRQLINMFINSYELEKPIIIDDFGPFVEENKILFVNEERSESEFKEWVKPDEKYCFSIEPLTEIDRIGMSLIHQEIPDSYML